jgi:hypothetical protein
MQIEDSRSTWQAQLGNNPNGWMVEGATGGLAKWTTSSG